MQNFQLSLFDLYMPHDQSIIPSPLRFPDFEELILIPNVEEMVAV
jgi:hypothetical protein